MKSKIIKVPIYLSSILVISTLDYKDVNEYYGTNIDENLYAAVVFKDKNDKIILAIQKKRLDIIAHEVVHIVNIIFKDCGVKLDLDNDEPQAYLTGYIFKEIIKFIDYETITTTKNK
jgi:hypothetical protein